MKKHKGVITKLAEDHYIIEVPELGEFGTLIGWYSPEDLDGMFEGMPVWIEYEEMQKYVRLVGYKITRRELEEHEKASKKELEEIDRMVNALGHPDECPKTGRPTTHAICKGCNRSCKYSRTGIWKSKK